MISDIFLARISEMVLKMMTVSFTTQFKVNEN